MDNKFFLKGKIQIHEETVALKERASKVIELPTEDKKQIDLMYISAILVSSGENLNHAYFLGSELFAAKDTIVNKALDIEHKEQDIIGHIYDKAFMDKNGNSLSVKELAGYNTASLDGQEMHIAIAAVIYKTRFPNFAEEVASGKWDSVSMECYYESYDVKIGDLFLNNKDAEVLGLTSSLIGRTAKVIKAGKEIASGIITRVLRNICFSGCGVVKNPANPPSKILEVASDEEIVKIDDIVVLDFDKIDKINNVTSGSIETSVKKEEINLNEKIDCLRNQEIRQFAVAAFKELIVKRAEQDKRKELLDGLKAALREAVKTLSR